MQTTGSRAGYYVPNGYGLYDMARNVHEWVNDWYASDYYRYCVIAGTLKNPPDPLGGADRVLRAGTWLQYSNHLRVGERYHRLPENVGSFPCAR
jgi:formylglycine-generating enzyme